MLYSMKALDGLAIAARDGRIGKVKDIYFDARHWTVRYLEVDTGGWLTGRRVLISPLSVNALEWDQGVIHLDLDKQQVHDSPGIDTHLPVTRQHEAALFDYYDYPYYWSGPYIWGSSALPALRAREPLEAVEEEAALNEMTEDRNVEDAALHCKDDVIGYELQAIGGVAGRVEDFLFDQRDWSIRLMVAEAQRASPNRHVLVAPQRIIGIVWEEKAVRIDLSKEQVAQCPEYDPRSRLEDVPGEVLQRPVPPGASSRQEGEG